MGHSAHQPAVLDDGGAAHALDDAAGGFQQGGIGDFQQQIPAVGPVGRLDL